MKGDSKDFGIHILAIGVKGSMLRMNKHKMGTPQKRKLPEVGSYYRVIL